MRPRTVCIAVCWLAALGGAVRADAPADLVLLAAEGPPGPWRVIRDGRLSDEPCPLAAPGGPGAGLRIEADLPGEAGAGLALAKPQGWWHPYTRLRARVFVPRQAPERVQAIVYIKDAGLWYQQHFRAAPLARGSWTELEVDLTALSTDWRPIGHHRPWDGYCRHDVQEVGIKFISDDAYAGPLFVDDVRLQQQPEALPTANVVYNLRPNAARIGRYELFELSFNLTRTYANPFDPEEADVGAVLTRPDGTTVRVPAFFYQGFLRRRERGAQVLVPAGRSQWRVRFAPRQLGTYRYRIDLGDSEPPGADLGTFRCVEGPSHGFVRRSRTDPDYFEFDDGTFFYPIGHNVAAVYDTRARGLGVDVPAEEGTYAYDRYLERMGAAGETFARVWMAPWNLGIEWTKAYEPHFKGLGRYSQQRAWSVDHVVETARAHGVYLMLLLTAHGEVGYVESDFKGTDPEHRQGSPYWSGNGGPLDEPTDMYTSPEARKFYKRKARYIAARWGYATSIMAWEILNEPDLGFRHSKNAVEIGRQCAEFVGDVIRHIRRYDPAGHLATSGIMRPMERYAQPTLALDELDFFAGHTFSQTIGPQMAALQRYLKERYGRMLMVTEAGPTAFAQSPVITARGIRSTLWTSYMLPLPSSATPWWWVFIDRKNLYGHFTPLAAFAEGEDRRGKGYAQAPAIAEDKGGRRDLRAYCLRNDSRGFCWVYEPSYFNRPTGGSDGKPQPAVVRLPGLPDGRYTIEVWDTRRGIATETFQADATGDALAFTLPPFVGDIACKLWSSAGEESQPAPE